MPRTAITVVDADYGLNLMAETAADQANGMSFVNDGRMVLVVSNEDASAKQVTLAVNPDAYGRDVTEQLSVPAGRVAMTSFLPPDVYNQAGSVVHVDFDADTDVKVGVFRLKI